MDNFDHMKRLWTLFINPLFFIPVGVVFALLTWLDFAMRHCNQVIDMWPCLSFMGRTFFVIAAVSFGGNVAVRILYVTAWPVLKWIGRKLMGAVTL